MKGVYACIAILGILALAFTFYHLYDPESCAPPEPKSQEEGIKYATDMRECAYKVAINREHVLSIFGTGS